MEAKGREDSKARTTNSGCLGISVAPVSEEGAARPGRAADRAGSQYRLTNVKTGQAEACPARLAMAAHNSRQEKAPVQGASALRARWLSPDCDPGHGIDRGRNGIYRRGL